MVCTPLFLHVSTMEQNCVTPVCKQRSNESHGFGIREEISGGDVLGGWWEGLLEIYFEWTRRMCLGRVGGKGRVGWLRG